MELNKISILSSLQRNYLSCDPEYTGDGQYLDVACCFNSQIIKDLDLPEDVQPEGVEYMWFWKNEGVEDFCTWEGVNIKNINALLNICLKEFLKNKIDRALKQFLNKSKEVK